MDTEQDTKFQDWTNCECEDAFIEANDSMLALADLLAAQSSMDLQGTTRQQVGLMIEGYAKTMRTAFYEAWKQLAGNVGRHVLERVDAPSVAAEPDDDDTPKDCREFPTNLDGRDELNIFAIKAICRVIELDAAHCEVPDDERADIMHGLMIAQRKLCEELTGKL